MKRYLLKSRIGDAWLTFEGRGMAYVENWDARAPKKPGSLEPWFLYKALCGFLRLKKDATTGLYRVLDGEWGRLVRWSKPKGLFVPVDSGEVMDSVQSAIAEALNQYVAQHPEHEREASIEALELDLALYRSTLAALQHDISQKQDDEKQCKLGIEAAEKQIQALRNETS